jgi:hypothetical protein
MKRLLQLKQCNFFCTDDDFSEKGWHLADDPETDLKT